MKNHAFLLDQIKEAYNKYLRLRFGFVNSIDTYSRLKMLVFFVKFLALNTFKFNQQLKPFFGTK